MRTEAELQTLKTYVDASIGVLMGMRDRSANAQEKHELGAIIMNWGYIGMALEVALGDIKQGNTVPRILSSMHASLKQMVEAFKTNPENFMSGDQIKPLEGVLADVGSILQSISDSPVRAAGDTVGEAVAAGADGVSAEPVASGTVE